MPLQACSGSWHAYDQGVALSRWITASVATGMATVMNIPLIRSGWLALTSVCDDSVERSVVLLALQQAPEEARQDPSWWPLSSESSAAVRVGWWKRWHPTLLARCSAASAPKKAEAAPDLAKATSCTAARWQGLQRFFHYSARPAWRINKRIEMLHVPRAAPCSN